MYLTAINAKHLHATAALLSSQVATRVALTGGSDPLASGTSG